MYSSQKQSVVGRAHRKQSQREIFAQQNKDLAWSQDSDQTYENENLVNRRQINCSMLSKQSKLSNTMEAKEAKATTPITQPLQEASSKDG